jgi:hypothetical protein
MTKLKMQFALDLLLFDCTFQLVCALMYSYVRCTMCDMYRFINITIYDIRDTPCLWCRERYRVCFVYTEREGERERERSCLCVKGECVQCSERLCFLYEVHREIVASF